MRRLLLLSLLAVLGCITEPKSAPGPVDGVYTATAFRSDGSIETQGWVRITVRADSTVDGTWQLSDLSGDGKLVGWQDGDTLRMNLHPGWADHNFGISGAYSSGSINGRWEFIGIAGPMKGGRFVGTKQDKN